MATEFPSFLRHPMARRTITVKLVFIFSLIILVTMTTTTLTTVKIMSEDTVRELRGNSQESLARVNTVLARHLAQAESLAGLLAVIEDVKSHLNKKELGELLDARQDIWYPAIVEIFDHRFQVIARSYPQGSRKEPYFTRGDEPFLKRTMELEFHADLYHTGNGLVLRATAPLVNFETLQVLGVVVVSYPVDKNLLYALKEETNTEITIQWNDEGRAISTLMEGDDPLSQMWPGGRHMIGSFVPPSQAREEKVAQQRYAVAYAPLSNNMGQNLGIVSCAVNFNTIERSQQEAFRLMGLGAGIAFVLSILVGLLIAPTIIKPLQRLVQASRAIARGNLQKRLTLDRFDEIGELKLAFNQMAASLEANQAELIEAGLAKDSYARRLEDSNRKLENFNTLLEEQVTERTAALQDANDKLLELDKMKTDFISTVSHELRTPLTSVLGFAKIIQKRLNKVVFPQIPCDQESERTRQQINNNIGIIIDESIRLTSLINELLDLSQLDSGGVTWEYDRVNLISVIRRAQKATASLFDQKGITLRLGPGRTCSSG